MRTACEAVLYGNIETINYPPSLKECCTGHDTLMRVCFIDFVAVLVTQWNI